MTTIAYDGNTLATDSQASSSEVICSKSEIKIYKPQSKDRWSIYGESVLAFGQAGDCGAEMELKNVMNSDLTYESQFMPTFEFSAIAVVGKDRMYLITKSQGDDKAKISLQIEPYAVGSGGLIARVAMHCGKSAVDAVRTAIAMDVYSGGEIQTFSI